MIFVFFRNRERAGNFGRKFAKKSSPVTLKNKSLCKFYHDTPKLCARIELQNYDPLQIKIPKHHNSNSKNSDRQLNLQKKDFIRK